MHTNALVYRHELCGRGEKPLWSGNLPLRCMRQLGSLRGLCPGLRVAEITDTHPQPVLPPAADTEMPPISPRYSAHHAESGE